MTPIKPSSTAIALLLLASSAAQSQDTVHGNILIIGRETGVMYAVPTGLAASLCGIDAARVTEASSALTGALAGSRLILCDAPQAMIDQSRLSPVTLVIPAPATVAPASAPATPESTAPAPGIAQDEAQMMVRISVGGAIVEVTPEQAAEACGIDVGTIRAGAAAGTAPAASNADIGSPAAAEEVEPDATTTNDPGAIAAEAPAADAPPATADAICEISREAAEAMGLPAPN